MIETLRLRLDPNDLASAVSRASIEGAAAILRRGGTVAFPTETVYGLGANALDAGAVEKIFIAKQRPAWDPLIVHISDGEMLRRVVASLPENAVRLMQVFWPGPLTLLLPKHADVPGIVTAGRPRVGVRMPAHPAAQALVKAAGLPVAAPSANTFGHISPTLAAHVAQDLEGRIDGILDGGEATHGLESTVVDVCEKPCVVYRPGVITMEQIRAVCLGGATAYAGDRNTVKEPPESLPSPGVGLRHYAPRARLVLIDGEGEPQRAAFRQAALAADTEGLRLGLMLPDSFQRTALDLHAKIFRWGNWEDGEELGQRLFAGLRHLDDLGMDLILCPLPPPKGIGVAIRDRLQKAARTE